jgi:hypothetical protein
MKFGIDKIEDAFKWGQVDSQAFKHVLNIINTFENRATLTRKRAK